MAIDPNTQTRMPLGVGKIISESFSILFKNIIYVMMLGFVPLVILLVISGVFLGWGVALGSGEPDFFTGSAVIVFILLLLFQLAIYGILIAMLVQMAYDAKLSRPITIGRYIGPALRGAFPIIVLMLVVSVLTGIGSIALIIPGLWIYAVFSVTTPAIVIEKVGFGGMGRSATLTKEYRWPIVGALIVIILCTVGLSLVVTFVYSIVLSVFGGGTFAIILSVLINAALTAVTYGLSAIGVSLIYARLREIKEGVGIDTLAAVFD